MGGVRYMRSITLDAIDNLINKNRKAANEVIRSTIPTTGRRKRSRTRSPGEIDALNQISIARWDKAVQEGKVKVIGERCLYYDYD